jgi:uncharacterized protein YecE (DUF72 family)
MSKTPGTLPKFNFRNLHPQILIGTASDRYSGWLGQIYSKDRYTGRIAKRTKIIAGKTFVEEVLPLDSVEEYFHHFHVLEIDFTFYRPLLDPNGQQTQNYQVLENYRRHLKDGDRNEAYLNPIIFTEQFYRPAANLLGSHLTGFIFEQEYQRQKDRPPVNRMAQDLDRFFKAIPKDTRYHLELRTDLYLRDQIFEVLEKHGVGQILSHWTWLPPLRKQLAKASGRYFNGGNECVIRLMTPLDMRYEDAYLKAHPFDRLVEGMMQPEMVLETVEIIRRAIEQGVTVNVIVNNRAGGNAPFIAEEIAKKFVGKIEPRVPEKMKLWDF